MHKILFDQTQEEKLLEEPQFGWSNAIGFNCVQGLDIRMS